MKLAKAKPIHKIDGLYFKSRNILDTYLELKQLQAQGLIKDFELPTADKTKNTKYKAQKCKIDGQTFDSIAEAKYYVHLLKEKQAGKIKDFASQVKFELIEGFKKNGKKIRPISYIADFVVEYNDNTKTAIDVKGKITKEFALKRKLFDFRYRDISLVCIKYCSGKWINIDDKQRKKRSNK